MRYPILTKAEIICCKCGTINEAAIVQTFGQCTLICRNCGNSMDFKFTSNSIMVDPNQNVTKTWQIKFRKEPPARFRKEPPARMPLGVNRISIPNSISRYKP